MSFGGGNIFGVAGAAPLPESRSNAVRDEARAAERADAKAEVRQAEATTTDQLTRTDFTNTLRALKSLNLTRSEQNTLRTVLSTILPPEIRSQETGLENLGEGESAQAFTPDAPEAADAPDVPSDHYVPEDAPSAESTQIGAHGDEAQDAAVARGDRKLYGTNPESKLDQALAKALPMAKAQHNFAEALRNPTANAAFLAEALQQNLTAQDKGAALLELMSLARSLRFALSKQNTCSPEGNLLAKALGQTIALGQALTRGMENVPDGFRQLFGQTVQTGDGAEGAESGVQIFSHCTAQEADQGDVYRDSVALRAKFQQFCSHSPVVNTAAQPMARAAAQPVVPNSSGAVPGQGGNRDDSTGRDRGTRGNKVALNEAKRPGQLRGSYAERSRLTG